MIVTRVRRLVWLLPLCFTPWNDACLGQVGAGGPPTEGPPVSERAVLELEWEIAQRLATLTRLALSPIIPGGVDPAPRTNPLHDPSRITRRHSLYAGQDVTQETALQSEIAQRRQQYERLTRQLAASGRPVPKLATCGDCDGRRVNWGAHAELGRRADDGSLGIVVAPSGLHACHACGGTGVKPPHATGQSTIRRRPRGALPPPLNTPPGSTAGPKHRNVDPIKMLEQIERVLDESSAASRDEIDQIFGRVERWLDRSQKSPQRRE